MISHKRKFIFIHIPKVAGTSIEEALRDETCQLLPREWDVARVPHAPLNHLTLQELADYSILTPAQLKSYFKFCFVRNPWDRMIAEIFYRGMRPVFRNLPVDQRIRRACKLASTTNGYGNHLRVQHDFVEADGLKMDFIGRFEHLEQDFDHVCRLLGIDADLQHLNRSDHRPYQEYYDEETRALTAAAYRRDIDAFQYKFEDASRSPIVRRKIKAYPLMHPAIPLEPAGNRDLEFTSVDRLGWQLCCPVAFQATWNGGERAEDIEVHVDGAGAHQPAFVQSSLGQGLLTFYSGYQFKSSDDQLLWLRGPINAPKDGLAALEAIIDTSVLPCTVAIQWQFTRSHHTIRFSAGEPFATLLPYARSGLEKVSVKVIVANGEGV